MNKLTGAVRFRQSRWRRKIIVEVEWSVSEYDNNTC